MTDRETTVAELKARVARFVGERQWKKYHKPKNLAMSIAIEAAELMELFQWLDHAGAAKALARKPMRQAVCHEMADILAFLLSLANAMDIDLAACFSEKMDRNDAKYPARKFRGHYTRPLRKR
jgi:NTP pyrophosphatase (non-canonical NTP hydrolase)